MKGKGEGQSLGYVCTLSAGALHGETFKTRGLSTPSKGNGGGVEKGRGEGHNAGLIQRQPHFANMVGFEAGLEDPCSHEMFSLLHNIPSLGSDDPLFLIAFRS